jgi:antitoxin ChpS
MGRKWIESTLSRSRYTSNSKVILSIMSIPLIHKCEYVMTEDQRWIVKCQDPADGSGDFIIDFPPDLLASLGLSIGDVLTVDVIDGAIVLTPMSSDLATP